MERARSRTTRPPDTTQTSPDNEQGVCNSGGHGRMTPKPKKTTPLFTLPKLDFRLKPVSFKSFKLNALRFKPKPGDAGKFQK